MPKLIKDFRITEKHQGGMAVVYKGENPSGFKRAFKAVRPDKAVNNAKLCDKFLKGISILQQLDHPNIVKAQDALRRYVSGLLRGLFMRITAMSYTSI